MSSKSGESEQVIDGPKCIEIPRGWSRISENGSILYISPNNSRLRSLDHVIEYLKTEGTCKCGLDCPLFVHKVFNFDARIPSKPTPVGSTPQPSKSGCKHCLTDHIDTGNLKKAAELATTQSNDGKLPSGSTLGPKRGPGRPRNALSKPRRVAVSKSDLDRPTSPLHNIPLPVPSSVLNSPVQSVPTNITVEQGPLPSFATIVSSSKLFNPSAGTLGLGSSVLGTASTAVTSAASSTPLTAASLQSSKPSVVVSSVATSSSFTIPVVAGSTGMATMQASKSSGSGTETVGSQNTLVVTAQLPAKKPSEATLVKSSVSPSSGARSSSLTVVAPSGKAPSKATVVSSSLTVVATTSSTPIPATEQGARPVSNANKFPDVRSTPKLAAPRGNKPAKSYSGRKTVAATLKAAAASKSSMPSGVAKTGFINTSQRLQAVASTATVSSVESTTTKIVGKLSTPTCSPSTTVVPALFHSVLKDAIKKDQGPVNRVVSSPSTNTSTSGTGHAVTSHSSKTSQQAAASSRSKTVASKEMAKVATAVVQGVAPIHVPPAVPQHGPSNRSQSAGTGYPLVNAGSSFYSPTSVSSSTSQPPIVQTSIMAQATAHIPPSSANVYGQVPNTSVASQIPSLQLASSQGQGGVFFQGNGGQVLQMNVDSSQLKGPYQLHGALYQGAIPATFLAATNAGKPVSSNAPGTALYPTNPYMLGIVMPTAITQANQAAQSVPTTATSPSATAAPVASYPYGNQNAAIAAAYESFVPIAPAASPRFSQTLAHLASAYTQFLPRGAVQGGTPVQFAAQRMVPMSSLHSQASGNGQLGPALLNIADYSVKYPINTVKPSSYASQASTISNIGSANTHPQTAVVAAMPYVAFGQIGSPRFPFSVNFANPGTSSNPSSTSSTTSTSSSLVSSVTTTHQHSSGTNVDSQGGGTVQGYVPMLVPFGTNPSVAGHSQSTSKAHPDSAFSPPSSRSSASHNSQRLDASGVTHGSVPSWCSGAKSTSAAATSQRRCSTPDNSSIRSSSSLSTSSSSSSLSNSGSNSNSNSCSATNSGTSVSLTTSKTSCAESNSSGITSRTSSSNCIQSPRHPGVSSPLNSPLPPLNQSPSGCRGSPISDSPLVSNRSSVEAVPSGIQTTNTSECHPPSNTPSSEMSCTLKRPYSESNDPAKKSKFDETAYYEANPLLGLKRSCEAIEAYCSPERKEDHGGDDDDEDDDDEEDSAVPKNERSSPVNHQTGEENANRKTVSNYNNCDHDDECRRGKSNSGEDQSNSAGMKPISDKHQTHSTYNGDVSANENQGLLENFSMAMVNQDRYLPVKTNSISPSTADEHLEKPRVPNVKPQFEIGDIVWAQARGLPSWPGKVVDASEVGKGRPDDGKRWVMWFGENTYSQVEVDRLKTLSDGLRTLDDKSRKKKYRAKKARISLEQAISEALEALDMRERLRGRQGARSKTKKKRLR